MRSRPRTWWAIVATALVLSVAGSVTAATASRPTTAGREKLVFDIAEDPTRFVFASEPVHDDGLPAYGNAFITQGYLYPEGTLVEGVDGVNPDGSPAFPELVLGEWTCWGYHVGDGAHTTEGPWEISSQLFQLGPAFGNRTIVTDGYELSEVETKVRRAITGGTGAYRNASGQQVEWLLGFGSVNSVKIRTELHVQVS
jgi:hypothetical protein